MPYVISTISSDQRYVDYHPNTDGGANVISHGVLIRGGANVAHKPFVFADGVTTPPGVMTEVSDSDLEFLKRVPAFQKHLEGGYLKIVHHNVAQAKIAAVVKDDMKTEDESAPITEKDYVEGGRFVNPDITAPKVGNQEPGKPGLLDKFFKSKEA